MTTKNEIIKRLKARREQACKFRDQASAENRPEIKKEWQARSESYWNAIQIVLEESSDTTLAEA